MLCNRFIASKHRDCFKDLEANECSLARDAFAKTCFDLIEEYAPGFSSSILGYDMLTPPDLERVLGLTGGNIFHGAMGLDVLFLLRPLKGWSGYRDSDTSEGAVHVWCACTPWWWCHGSSWSKCNKWCFRRSSEIVALGLDQRLSRGLFHEVITTKTIPLREKHYFPQLTVLSVANLLGETIWQVHEEGSAKPEKYFSLS